MDKFTISRLAEFCNVKNDTIRYYERYGLIQPIGRTNAGYRLYDKKSIRKLKFIKNAQSLGFKLEEVKKLLYFDHSDKKTANDVLATTKKKVAEIRQKNKDLKTILKTLEKLVTLCPGEGSTSECPILEYIYPT
ncbi:MerR family transcriptional regulator [Nitrospina gracilis]|nr:MerR family transcriptional regulator [Nitrospina gracilis]